MDNEKRYTLEEIKRAFWRRFHGAGEQWFNYQGTEEKNQSCTQSHWEEFLEALNE